ncbi:unnamed protein product, partial [Staurois parvus]
LLLAHCSQTSTILLATAKPRHVHQIARQRSVIHHSREHISTALVSSGVSARVAVVPSCFHFVIIPLAAERGIFSSKDISRMHRWQPIMVPLLNSLSF